MAHKTSKPSCSNKKEQFLFDKVPFQQFLSKSTLFRFFKFGSNCNGNAGHSFSGATCDLKRKVDQNESQWYGILMSQLFESGYSFLQSKLDSKKSTCFDHVDERMTALKTLIKFFAEKGRYLCMYVLFKSLQHLVYSATLVFVSYIFY